MNPEPKTRATWVNYIPSGIVVLAAVTIIILAPFYAIQWYRLPFLGLLLEPNMVVANYEATDWPALEAGVQYPDRLITAGGSSVQTASDLQEILTQNQFEPITLSFEHQDGNSPYEVTITPRSLNPGEFLRLFITPYLVGLIFLLIGLWAFQLDTSNHPVRIFLLFTAGISISTSAIFDLHTSHNLALLWVLSIPITAGALAQLGLVFPRRVGFVKRHNFLRLIPWLVTIAFALPSTLQYLDPSTPWAYIPTWLNNYAFAGVVVLIFIAILLWRALYDVKPVIQQQSRIIVFGSILAFGPIFILFFLPVALGYIKPFRTALLIPPLLIFPLSVAYAIVRYRLLNVDRFLGNSLSYLISSSFAITIYYLLVTIMSFLLERQITINDPSVMAVFLILVVGLLNPLRTLVQNNIDQIFYRNQSDFQQVLTNLSQDLGETADMKRIYYLLKDSIKETFDPETFLIYILDKERDQYLPFPPRNNTGIPLDSSNPLIQHLKQISKTVWYPPEISSAINLEALTDFIQEFGTHVFVPLIYEGDIIGLLALSGRRSGRPYNEEDLEFLDAIAAQSSLAVEISRLINNLRFKNIELENAYNSTLEGWSRAMDLRDKETEGHTQRVTELTVRLCKEYQFNETEIANIRRGSLLHDIGKMGIPDGILLKNENLDKVEWETMKKHTIFAYEMLSPIEYLNQALDIPYCHHEKWDGSGYPRGLKGEDIPITARIFAIVDVYDALRSDRSYRKAWSLSETLEYIQEESGKHFDPEVVEIFLGVINGGGSNA